MLKAMDPLTSRTRLHHATVYRFDRPVALGPHIVRLRPAPEAEHRIDDYSLRVTPEPQSIHWQQDPHRNWLARLLFDRRASELRLDVELEVDMALINPFGFLIDPSAERWPLVYAPELRLELRSSLAWGQAGPGLAAFVHSSRAGSERNTLESLVAINQDIHRRIRYVDRPAGEVQSPDETLALKTGSCRDLAWLAVEALRQLGCAARFVSGYLLSLDYAAEGEPERPDAGLHAWAAVYLPGAGWLGLDPTSGTLCGEAYLPLASTSHYGSAAPVTGSSESAGVEASFQFEAAPVG